MPQSDNQTGYVVTYEGWSYRAENADTEYEAIREALPYFAEQSGEAVDRERVEAVRLSDD
jgi:hypothetical protein